MLTGPTSSPSLLWKTAPQLRTVDAVEGVEAATVVSMRKTPPTPLRTAHLLRMVPLLRTADAAAVVVVEGAAADAAEDAAAVVVEDAAAGAAEDAAADAAEGAAAVVAEDAAAAAVDVDVVGLP